MADLKDTSTAPLSTKLCRLLEHLANPADTVYFYGDGYPKPDIHGQASVFLRLIREGRIVVTDGVPEVQPDQPLNGIPATWQHDEGAYAQCGDCGRYSADPASLRIRAFACECGSASGWCGSFKRPGPDAKWSGRAPGVEGKTNG